MNEINNEITSLPEGYCIRPVEMEDIGTFLEILNDYWEPFLGVRKFTEEDIRRIFTSPGFDNRASTRLVLSPEGRPAGGILVWDVPSPPVHPLIYGAVRKEFEGRGIGTYMLHWAETRSRQAISRVEEGVRVIVRATSSIGHEPTVNLFKKRGMQPIRYSWMMIMDLDKEPHKPQWPDGITISSFRDHPDLKSIYRAVNDSFQDHWGYVERDEQESIKRWEHRLESDKDFDPTLWYLAMDGDDIAGLALCEPQVGDNPDLAIVETLGVRRSWRRRGLGLALLRHAFVEFYAHSKKQVGLGVDAQSLTGATRLYEKAGMRVHQQLVTYDLELRPGEEISKQD